jgi:hypothetical protein
MRRARSWIVFAFAGQGVLTAQQGDEPTVVVRSLLPFLNPSLQSRAESWSALPDDSDSDTTDLGLPSEENTNSVWLEGLLKAVHGGAIDAGDVALRFPNDNGGGQPATMTLSGKARAVAAVQRTLDAVAAIVARPIEVTAMQLPLGDGALPAAQWDAAATQQALQQATRLWTATARTKSGDALRLANERGIGFVRDIDVEVAEKAKIGDPKLDVAFAGARCTLTVNAAPGDQLELVGSWLHSVPIATDEQPIGPDQSRLDQPAHFTVAASFAGRIDAGGALVVAGRGDGPGGDGFVLVVTARYLAPPAGDPAADLLVRSVGALLPTSAAPLLDFGWRRPRNDLPRARPSQLAGGLDAAGLLAMLQVESPGEAGIDGGVLVVHGDATACRRADALVQQLFEQSASASLLTRISDGRATTLELVQPILGDRPASAFGGREQLVLRDQEVEIAARAAIANPVPAVACAGVWLHAASSRIGSNWHLTGQWTVQALAEPRLRVHREVPPMHLQLIDYRAVTLPWDAPIAPTNEHVLGDAPVLVNGTPPPRVTITLTPH